MMLTQTFFPAFCSVTEHKAKSHLQQQALMSNRTLAMERNYCAWLVSKVCVLFLLDRVRDMTVDFHCYECREVVGRRVAVYKFRLPLCGKSRKGCLVISLSLYVYVCVCVCARAYVCVLLMTYLSQAFAVQTF